MKKGLYNVKGQATLRLGNSNSLTTAIFSDEQSLLNPIRLPKEMISGSH